MLNLTCTLYYDFHHSSDWWQKWSNGDQLVIEQGYAENSCVIINHTTKIITIDDQYNLSYYEGRYPDYQTFLNENACCQLLKSDRTCDCTSCKK